MPRILWIEDDYFHLQGLARPLAKEGFEIVPAYSSANGIKALGEWQSYDVIILDLILPTSMTEEAAPAPDFGKAKFVGVGLLRYMLEELRVTVPIIVLSVVTDPAVCAEIEALGVEILRKGDLLPRQVQESVHKALGRTE